MNKFCTGAITLVLLSWGLSAIADSQPFDFDVDLSIYEEGDIPTTLLGEKIVIKTDTQDSGEKVNYVTGQSSSRTGKIQVNSIHLSNPFEVIIEVLLADYSDAEIVLVSEENGELTKLTVSGYSITLGSNDRVYSSDISSWKRDKVNSIKLKFDGNLVKFYVNGDFVQSSSLDNPNLTATRLEIDKLNNEHHIFAIKGRNLGTGGSSSSPTVNTPQVNVSPEVEATIREAAMQVCRSNPASCGITVDSSCTTQKASYNPNAGELYIPAVNVPDAFGGITTYEVYLTQQPSSFTFNLDLNRVTPR